MFRLAHLSDVHLAPLPKAHLRDLLSKRIIGYLNWHALGRGRAHQRAAINALVDDLKIQAPHHTVVTGDLVNIALPEEFSEARRWLEQLGAPDDVTVVPGNHDAYVRFPFENGIGQWAPYFRSNDAGREFAADDHPFPFVRIKDDIALIGVSTAVPTPPFFAIGSLGPEQCRALQSILDKLGGTGLCIVLLIHHPPLPGLARKFEHLTDAAGLAEILRASPVDLVLHGHNHTATVTWGEGPERRYPVVGVPSGSMALPGSKPLARYNLYQLSRAAGGWAVEMTSWGMRERSEGVHQIERAVLDPQSAVV